MTVQTWLAHHLKRYPEARLTDLYKYLHQACFGSSESISQPANTEDWLAYQWKELPANNAPLLEGIGDNWVRLHLHPYQHSGGEFAPLLQAVLESAQAKTQATDQMAAAWEAFGAWVATEKKWSVQFPAREVRLFGQVYAAQQWAITQHSPQFIRTYHPIYRLLTRHHAQTLCQTQGLPVKIN